MTYSNLFRSFTWKWLALSVIALLFVPVLLNEGMFFDGLTYATISRNLAEGNGSFWDLQYNNYPFYDQPPLMMYMQSWLFRIFGDGIWIEKFWCLLLLPIHFFLFFKLWKTLTDDEKELNQTKWFSLLLWYTMPVVMWIFTNNMLEYTMNIFCVSAILFMISGVKSSNKRNTILSGIFSGGFLLLAFLTKGFPGLFPFAVPLIYVFILKREKWMNAVIVTLTSIAVFAIAFFILYQQANAHSFLHTYLNGHLLSSLKGVNYHEGFWGRFYIIRAIFNQLTILLIVTAVFSLPMLKHKSFRPTKQHLKLALLCLLVAISASVPIIASAKQRSFYLFPSSVFFAMSFSFFISNSSNKIAEFIMEKRKIAVAMKSLSIALGVTTIILSAAFLKQPYFNSKIVHDTKQIGLMVSQNEGIEFFDTVCCSWTLVAFSNRYNHQYMEGMGSGENKNWGISKKEPTNEIIENLNSQGYKNVNAELFNYILWKKE